MKPQGTIYDSSWFSEPEKIQPLELPSKKSQFDVYRPIFKFVGKSLVVFAFSLIIMTFTPLMAAEFKIHTDKLGQLTGLKPSPQPKSGFAYLLDQEQLPAEDQRFQLIIPKLNIDSKILANIDPNNKDKYQPALQQGIAHSQGSGLPGEVGPTKTVYLFAHSTDVQANVVVYNAIFYQLKDLEENDRIIVWFWGKKFVYRVDKKEILAKNNTQYFQPQLEKDLLVLQTCWPPGTSLKQLVIVAELEN